MGKIRSLKPGFCTSESIVALSIPERLHFAMLWTYADDFGRGVDNPRLLKAALWPLDDDMTSERVNELQKALQAAGRIWRYITKDGKRLFEIVNWEEHQHPKSPVESLYPAHDDPSIACIYIANGEMQFPGRPLTDPEPTPDRPIEESNNPLVVVVEVEGGGVGEVDIAPRTAQGGDDPLFDSLVTVVGIDPDSLTPSGRGEINHALKELRVAKADPLEIPDRALRYRQRYPKAALTPSALAKHWGALAPPTQANANTITSNQAVLARMAANE